MLDAPASRTRVEEARLGQILGKDFLLRSVPMEHHAGPVEIAGWIGLPTASRGQPDQQFWFVNGRAVRDKLLMNAVRVAYRDVLYGGRHAAYVLYLTLDPRLVDVNAHPSKLEVRFRDSRQIHEFVFRAIERVLANTKPDMTAAPAAVAEFSGGAGIGIRTRGTAASAPVRASAAVRLPYRPSRMVPMPAMRHRMSPSLPFYQAVAGPVGR